MKSGVHTLVTGKTDTGKSAIVKRLIRDHFRRSGKYKKILVLDPKIDPGFLADFITGDPAEFLEVAEAETDCLLVLDESGETVGAHAGAVRKIATMHRGLGHQAFFITQRGAMLDKTIREQCSNLFIFRQGSEDARELARSFPDLKPYIDDVPQLEQGQFFYVPSFGKVTKDRAF